MASLYDVGFNGGSVDAQPSISKVTKLTKKIDNLQPGVTYTILIRAKKNGQLSDYASYVYKVPETDKSGNNFTVSNQNTDIQLLGGGFAASKTTDQLPINIGKIQVSDVLTTGTGVILNQYGLIGYKAGTKTFYINAGTGDAYFGGTVTAGAIISDSAIFGSSGNTISQTTSNISTAQSTAGNAYNLAATKLTKSANTITDVNNNMTAIKADGITVYSGANPSSGARVLMNNQGLVGFDSTSTNNSTGITFSVLSSNGNATFKGAIESGSTITGATFKTGSGSNYIQIYDQGSYGEILFKNGALYTPGSIYGSTEQILIISPIKSGHTGFSSIALGGESDVVNSRLSLQSGGYYIHLDAITGLDYIGPMVSAGAASTGLRKISVQNGGSASGGADGDIILIY